MFNNAIVNLTVKSRLFDNPFSKCLIFKMIFLHAIAVLGYLAKLERGLWLAFGAHFLHDFYLKMFLT